MNAVAVRLNAGDVVELELDGLAMSALVLLVSDDDDKVILDACDGSTPFVADLRDLDSIRIFDGEAV